MWRVCLSFVTHRLFLLLVALCALHFKNGGQVSPAALLNQFFETVSQTSEVKAIQSEASSPEEPLLWIAQKVSKTLHFSEVYTLLILSNVFLFLFLWELYLFVNTMALPDVAVDTCLLTILWMTSYELSLGSSLSLSCFLCILSLRAALDHRWLIAGLSIGALALSKPLALFLLPLLFFILFHQREYSSPDAFARRCIYLFVPFGLAIFFHRSFYQNLGAIFQSSSLMSLVTIEKSSEGLQWAISLANLGQTITLITLVIASCICFFVFSSFLHRILPAFLVFSLLATTPFPDLASYAVLAAPAFSGIAEAFSSPFLRLCQLLLLILGTLEVFNLF